MAAPVILSGQVTPRYRITLASGVSEEVCRRVNLGFLDYRTLRRDDYEKDPETFVVENAGRDLYLVEPNVCYELFFQG